MQTLRVGSRGREVAIVQEALNRVMVPPVNRLTRPPLAPLVPDGKFGGKTDAMVREFQRLNQVSIDGAVGPITSYLLLPFISFSTELQGKGRIRGRRGELPVARSLVRRVQFIGVSAAKAKGLVSADGVDGGDDDDEAITVDVTVGSGNGSSFKPWFVLKPEEQEAPEAEGTVAINSTILRKKGFEFGGSLEFSRPMIAESGPWKWAGSISGSYTNLKTQDGLLSLSPVVDLSVKQGLQAGAGAGLEATIHLLDDKLNLTVGGKLAAEVDMDEGTVKVGPAIGVGMKLKFDFLRFGK